MDRSVPALLALIMVASACDRTMTAPAGTLERTDARDVTTPASILDLGVLPGGTSSQAYAIGDDGTIVGFSVGSGRRAFRWTETGGMEDLGVLRAGSDSYAHAVNRHGQVVGYDNHANAWYGASRALLWEPGQPPVDLSGQDGYQAFGINDLGHVVGLSVNGAWRWTPQGGLEPLAGLASCPGGECPAARDINDRGEIVGTTVSGFGAWYWSAETGVITIHSGQGEALAINAHGQVTGWIGTQGGLRAFVWTRDEGFHLIEPPPGFFRTRGMGINDQGQVVGFMENNTPGLPPTRAFMWTAGTGVVDLGALPEGSGVAQAYDINNQGYAVGASHAASGASHAVRWDVNQIVPPPNRPPALRELEPLHTVQAGQALQFEVEADDPDGDAVTIVVDDAPSGANFFLVGQQPGYARGRFQWVPQAHQVGSHQVTFQAIDQHGARSEPAVVTIVVEPATPPPPQCTSPGLEITVASGAIPGTISLGDLEVTATVWNIEAHIPPHNPRTTPDDLRLGRAWATATPSRSRVIRDIDRDGTRDVRLRFETDRLVADGNLAPDTEEITVFGRDPVTGELFCGTVSVMVVP
jgi:probable HAF family extracellular repeat protein